MPVGFPCYCSSRRSGEVGLDDAGDCEAPDTIPSAAPALRQAGTAQGTLDCIKGKEDFVK